VINGLWSGTLVSSHDQYSKQMPVTVEFRQYLSGLRVHFHSQTSASGSLFAGIVEEDNGMFNIYCVYRNEPMGGARGQLSIHHGTMILTLEEPNRIEGFYFNYPPERATDGRIHLARVRGVSGHGTSLNERKTSTSN